VFIKRTDGAKPSELSSPARARLRRKPDDLDVMRQIDPSATPGVAF